MYQAGTLSGNPLAMVAGIKTLEILDRLVFLSFFLSFFLSTFFFVEVEFLQKEKNSLTFPIKTIITKNQIPGPEPTSTSPRPPSA